MNLTMHARERCRQRAIPPMVVELLIRFGRRERAGDGLAKVYLDKAARRQIKAYAGPLSSVLDKHLDVYLVVNPDDRVVTAAHRLERFKRH